MCSCFVKAWPFPVAPQQSRVSSSPYFESSALMCLLTLTPFALASRTTLSAVSKSVRKVKRCSRVGFVLVGTIAVCFRCFLGVGRGWLCQMCQSLFCGCLFVSIPARAKASRFVGAPTRRAPFLWVPNVPSVPDVWRVPGLSLLSRCKGSGEQVKGGGCSGVLLPE